MKISKQKAASFSQAAVGGQTAPCFAFLTIYTLPQEIIINLQKLKKKKYYKSSSLKIATTVLELQAVNYRLVYFQLLRQQSFLYKGQGVVILPCTTRPVGNSAWQIIKNCISEGPSCIFPPVYKCPFILTDPVFLRTCFNFSGWLRKTPKGK